MKSKDRRRRGFQTCAPPVFFGVETTAREYKFRGRRKDNGEWAIGYAFKAGKQSFIIPEDAEINSGQLCGYECEPPLDYLLDFIEVDPATVGEYIGLYDKNGKVQKGEMT